MKKIFRGGRLRKGISIVASMVLLLSSIMPTVPVFAETGAALKAGETCTYVDGDPVNSLEDETEYDIVAKIGSYCYTTLAGAVAAAADGETVKLNKDITMNSVLVLNEAKAVTLDLQGYTITAGANAIRIDDGDLTINGNGGIELSSDGSVITVNNGNCTITNGTYVGGNVIYSHGSTSIVTINGGTFNGTRLGNAAEIHAVHGGIITINDGTFIARKGADEEGPAKNLKVLYAGGDANACESANTDYYEGGTINVNGGHFEGRLSRSNGGTYNIHGGTFIPTEVAKIGCDYSACSGGSGEPTGCHNGEMNDMLPEGYIAQATATEGEYQVILGYNITWNYKNADGTAASETTPVAKDATPSHADPAAYIDATSHRTYTFVSWGDIAPATADATYTATYDDGVCDADGGYVEINNTCVLGYNITYTLNGGAWAEGYEPTTSVEYNTALAEPDSSKLSKANNVFKGWTLNDAAYDFATPVTAPITLVATWEEVYTPTGDIVVPQEGTTAQAQGSAVAIPDMTDIKMVSPEDPITVTSTVVLQETKGDAALTEIAEDESSSKTAVQAEILSELNNIVAQTDVTKTADMKGIVDIQFIQVSSTGATSDLPNKVNFNKPVAIKIPVTSGVTSVKVRVKHTGETAYGTVGLTTDQTATCNTTNGTVNEAAKQYDGGDVAVNNNIAVIYTCSASSFVAYTEVNKSTPSGSGGGGGGSSSYSCKNLPDNAVANNTSKPKKSTDYSYSTDTDAVCTFQCKSGYAWNEKDAKCELSESTTTGDNVGVDSDSTDNTDANNISDEDRAAADAQALKDGYSQEFIDAYNFARKNNITTMNTIREANMDAPLTRIAMAKMLSQYAINVLGKTPDTSIVVPTFPDVDAKLDADYNNGVTLAYQLGIMGIGIEKFRPFDLVTRAEFGTALSRMLFGLEDGEGNEWYSTHLAKLMEEKIITNDNPNLKELRGYVMIMLMRSAQ